MYLSKVTKYLYFVTFRTFQNIKVNWHTYVEGCTAGPHFSHWVKGVTIPQALSATGIRSTHHEKLVLQETHT